MKIIIYTKYNSLGPSSRYRYYNYVECFKKKSLDVFIESFFSENYLAENTLPIKLYIVLKAYLLRFVSIFKLILTPKTYQLVIIEYELFPYCSGFFEFLLKKRRIPYIVDYDDAIFHKYDRHQNPVIRWLLKNKISKVMQNAEAVIVGNNYLGEYAKKFNSKILQLPTVVLLDNYISALENVSAKKNNAPFVIGWIGSRTTSQYILDILPAIKEFVASHNAECRFIGIDESLLTDVMNEQCKITIVPWSEETEVQEILKFDIGIMPLKDDAWSKGKCGFKLIQYMSCKKPVIASPIGINVKIVEEDVNGYLASTKSEWLSAFKKLHDDESLRKAMATNNWKKIKAEYNHKLNCEKYISLIKNIVNHT
jgi:glycosyltransferase involved in cell wall biosynthesis